MVDATDSRPGLAPDRASVSTALNAARDQLVQAAGIIADTGIDPVGVIGEHVLANLLRAPDPGEGTHDQTLELQIPGPRPHHRPPHLQGHHQSEERIAERTSSEGGL